MKSCKFTAERNVLQKIQCQKAEANQHDPPSECPRLEPPQCYHGYRKESGHYERMYIEDDIQIVREKRQSEREENEREYDELLADVQIVICGQCTATGYQQESK